MKSSSGKYFPQLDHLRFLAALLVFYWHFCHRYIPTKYIPGNPLLSIFAQGHTGVSLFMAISGFIFTYLSYGHNVSAINFYKNRFFRIYPLYLFYCLFYFLKNKIDPLKMLASTIFLLNNDTAPGGSWTIVVEFQFYILFPFLLLFINKIGIKYIFTVILFSVLLKAIVWFSSNSVQDLSYWTIFGKIDPLLCGVIAAFVCKKYDLRKEIYLAIFILSVSCLFYVYRIFNIHGGFFDMDKYPSTSLFWVFLPTIEGILYSGLVFSYLKLDFLPRKISTFLASCGEVSFSMYLGHFLIIELFVKLFSAGGVAIESYSKAFLLGTFIVLPACLAYSRLTYTVIEYPFLKFRKPYLLEPHESPFSKVLPSPGSTQSEDIKLGTDALSLRTIFMSIFILIALATACFYAQPLKKAQDAVMGTIHRVAAIDLFPQKNIH